MRALVAVDPDQRFTTSSWLTVATVKTHWQAFVEAVLTCECVSMYCIDSKASVGLLFAHSNLAFLVREDFVYPRCR